MRDVLFVLLTIASFALAAGYVRACALVLDEGAAIGPHGDGASDGHGREGAGAGAGGR